MHYSEELNWLRRLRESYYVNGRVRRCHVGAVLALIDPDKYTYHIEYWNKEPNKTIYLDDDKFYWLFITATKSILINRKDHQTSRRFQRESTRVMEKTS